MSFGPTLAKRHGMRRALLSLLTAVLLSGALPVHAGTRAASKPKLTAKIQSEVRRDATSLMGWSVRLLSGKNPRVRTTFTPSKRNEVEVEAELAAGRGNGRVVETNRSGTIKLLGGGEWAWKDRWPHRELFGPKDPVESVRQRESSVDNAAIVRRAPGKAFVIYSSTYRGNELRIVTIDTRTGRPLARSKNLARDAMGAAVKAARKSGWQHLNSTVLRPLAKDGKSVDVDIYTSRNGGGPPDHRTAFRVELDSHGKPTGTVREIKSVYIGD
jgi:hypothetical protein